MRIEDLTLGIAEKICLSFNPQKCPTDLWRGLHAWGSWQSHAEDAEECLKTGEMEDFEVIANGANYFHHEFEIRRGAVADYLSQLNIQDWTNSK